MVTLFLSGLYGRVNKKLLVGGLKELIKAGHSIRSDALFYIFSTFFII